MPPPTWVPLPRKRVCAASSQRELWRRVCVQLCRVWDCLITAEWLEHPPGFELGLGYFGQITSMAWASAFSLRSSGSESFVTKLVLHLRRTLPPETTLTRSPDGAAFQICTFKSESICT